MNILVSLANQLRGKSCRPFHGEWSVQTKPGQIRRPDVAIDCGTFDPKSYTASMPVMIAEILSPTTRDFDTYRKAEEYKLIPTLRRILLVDPNRAEVFMWDRPERGDWEYSTIEGLENQIEMPEVEVILQMAEIYRDLALPIDLKVIQE